MKRRVLIIINPISGTLSKDGLEERVAPRFGPAIYEVECVRTRYAGHAFELARKAADESAYAVIAAGGDGTINEVASALRDTNTALGVLPFGSGNGLARHLLTSIDIDHAIDVLVKDRPVRSDYGTVNGEPFFCTFGLGFDANVSREFASMPTRGLLSYLRSVVTQWFSYSPMKYKITVDTGVSRHSMTVKAFLIAVCNASQYGNNAFIAPKASVCDGMLDMVIIHDGNPVEKAIAGAELFTGHIDRNILIDTIRFKKARIQHMPGAAHIDGEPRTVPETLDIECHPGKLWILSDPDKVPFRPFFTTIESIRDDSSFIVRENAKTVLRNFLKLLS